MFPLIWEINSMIGLKKRFFRNIYSEYFTHISNIYKEEYISKVFSEANAHITNPIDAIDGRGLIKTLRINFN